MHVRHFDIAIAELTSMMPRWGLYCAKYPDGQFSISAFDDDEGNIRFYELSYT